MLFIFKKIKKKIITKPLLSAASETKKIFILLVYQESSPPLSNILASLTVLPSPRQSYDTNCSALGPLDT